MRTCMRLTGQTGAYAGFPASVLICHLIGRPNAFPKLVQSSRKRRPRFGVHTWRCPHAVSPAEPAQPAPEEPAKELSAESIASGGSFLGAMALITSNTVGAGMLALPSFTADCGLAPSAALLVSIWALLTLEALLIAEVNLAVGETLRSSQPSQVGATGCSGSGSHGGGGGGSLVTLRQMVEHTLGGVGKGLVVFYLLLSACFLVAYTCKSVEVLDFFTGGALPPVLAAPCFVGAMAALMYFGGNARVDKVNQGLTVIILALYLLILTTGALQIDWGEAHTASNWGAAAKAVPVAFLALLYHDLVPVICMQLGNNRAAVRSALLLGGIVPLAMFLYWEALALNLIPPQQGGAAGTVDLLEVFVRQSPPLVGSLVEAFSGLTVMTCFLGTTLGMSETLRTEVPLLLAKLRTQQTQQGQQPQHNQAQQGQQQAQQQQVQPAVQQRVSGPLGAGGQGSWSSGRSGSAGDAAEPSAGGAARGAEGGAQGEAQGKVAAEAPASGSRVGPSEDGSSEGGPSEGGSSQDWRGLALALSLGPPLLFTAARPDLFLGALDVAGAYGLTLLYGLLPPLMVWQLRRQQQEASRAAGTGGAASLVPAAAAAAAKAATAAEGAPGQMQLQVQQLGSGSERAAESSSNSRGDTGSSSSSSNSRGDTGSSSSSSSSSEGSMVPGGTPVLAAMFLVVGAITGGRIAADVGLPLGQYAALLSQAVGGD